MKAGAKLTIQGTVQGVFYRQFAKENADKLKLKGFVRNLTNGNVEVIVEGEKDNIEKLKGILLKGPQHSQIRNINKEEKKWTGDFKEFKILRI
jgi:acylphosphatase